MPQVLMYRRHGWRELAWAWRDNPSLGQPFLRYDTATRTTEILDLLPVDVVAWVTKAQAAADAQAGTAAVG